MVDTQAAKPNFEQVRREHEEFKTMIAAIRDFLGRPRPGPGEPEGHGWAVDLSKQLVTLHDKLVGHFHHEEQGGLCEYSEGSPAEDPHLRQRVTAVLDRLGAHEVAETDLMQRVEYRDLGTGD